MNDFSGVRVRIAPSPTGDPHVGTAYVALFNYAFAKRNNGKFILRIEDTDQSRFRASSERLVITSLHWLGLNWDEGPDIGGTCGPYRQSERRDIYPQYVQQLLAGGHAYRCFCTAERLAEMREQQKKAGLSTAGYDRCCRGLPEAEVKKEVTANTPHVVRLKVPLDGTTSFHDEIRGEIIINNEQIDDQVLLKSDGFPTYHLANVVDDHLMKISHVIRAEEWISSTPKHAILYRSFGWQEPKWVHLPILRNADRSKISKRRNPVSLSYYRRAGILPHALLNFLALMGWSFGDDVEIFSIKDMCEKFDFGKIKIGGPVFDQEKLNWLNQVYLQKLSAEEFARYLQVEVFTTPYLKLLKPLLGERISRFDQFVDKASFFFNGSLDYKSLEIIPKAMDPKVFCRMVESLVDQLDELYDWDQGHLDTLLNDNLKKLGWKAKDYFMPIRLITTGRKDSPPLVETLFVLGRDIVRFRLRDYLSQTNA